MVPGLFFRRSVALGDPVVVVVLEQLFERRGRRGDDPEKVLGAGVQGITEAEIPFFFRSQAVDVLQPVAERTGPVEGYLGIA
jgi:hypothetical protein